MRQLLFSLHALGHDLKVEAVTQGDDRVRDRRIAGICRKVPDEQLIDLECVQRKVFDALEGIDPDRSNAALDAYRSDTGQPEEVSQPININVGGQ